MKERIAHIPIEEYDQLRAKNKELELIKQKKSYGMTIYNSYCSGNVGYESIEIATTKKDLIDLFGKVIEERTHEINKISDMKSRLFERAIKAEAREGELEAKVTELERKLKKKWF